MILRSSNVRQSPYPTPIDSWITWTMGGREGHGSHARGDPPSRILASGSLDQAIVFSVQSATELNHNLLQLLNSFGLSS
jgi:hypothetical protein